MADNMIPMAGTAIDTATPIYNSNDQAMQNMLATQQTLKAHYENLDAREKSRLQSVIAGAVQLKPFLDSQDIQGATDFLTKRRTSLQSRMGAGETVDTQETDYALEALRSGNVEQLSQEIQGLMAAGQVYGILGNQDQPSSVQEWQYYNQLSPQDQERYLTMKRSNASINLGGSQIIPSQTNPAGPPQAAFPVTLRPEDQPQNAEAKAEATARGASAAESEANASNTIQKAGGLLAALEDLKSASQVAPSGALGSVAASTLSLSGVGGEMAQAQGTFTVKRAAAENAIRQAFRVVGSGATSDRDALPFIQMLPNEMDSQDVKIAKTDAAMQAVRVATSALAAQRGLSDPFATGAPVQVTSEEEALQLPAGTKFMLNGKTGTVQ